MTETPPPSPPPRGRPIAGPSKLALQLRWGGLGLFVLGVLLSLVPYYLKGDEAIGLAGLGLIALSFVALLVSSLLRFFQWR